MTQAIRIDAYGGPEQMKLVDVEVGQPVPARSASATWPAA
jgi:hypothetical protein